MGDISREPLPGGPRTRGPVGKGPSEVIRLDELTVEDRMSSADPRDGARGADGPGDELPEDPAARTDDPAARAFPSPRFAPAAPMRLEPFGRFGLPEPEAGCPVDAGLVEAVPVDAALVDAVPVDAVPVDVAPSAEAAAADAPVDPHEDLLEAEVEAAALEALALDASLLDAALPDAVPAEVALPDEHRLEADLGDAQLEEIAVPDVEELVDPDGEERRAEPTLARDTDEDVDDAPPLTDPAEVARVLLPVLLCSREPLGALRLAEICNTTQKVVQAALEELERGLHAQGFPLELLWVDDAVRLATAPVVFPYLSRLKKLKKAERLSPAALETLAVIAYRQPVIRAEIEAIRGVKVGPMLKSLLDHKLVTVVGRSEVPGRPLQYGTTQTFLDRFGLRSLKDLPSVQEFRSLG